jgi:uncharacterized protein with LGFP repeats
MKAKIGLGTLLVTAGVSLPAWGLPPGGIGSPTAITGPILYKWREVKDVVGGSENSGPIWTTDDGRAQYVHFPNGSIYYTAQTGAQVLLGAIKTRWFEIGAGGFLGYPTTDELVASDNFGRYNDFEYGSIYWTSQTGAFEIYGAIRDRWLALGDVRGFLGYPATPEYETADRRGRKVTFKVCGAVSGHIYWSPASGAHSIRGKIYDYWKSQGGESGKFGYPIREEYPIGSASDGQVLVVNQSFEKDGGMIHWWPGTNVVNSSFNRNTPPPADPPPAAPPPSPGAGNDPANNLPAYPFGFFPNL